jgi:predicted dehydrogenase
MIFPIVTSRQQRLPVVELGGRQRTTAREPARRAVEKFYAKEKGLGKYRGCRAYRELLAKEQVDAVMVATRGMKSRPRWACPSGAG